MNTLKEQPDLTEEKLLKIGFEKFLEPAKETGNEHDYYYFTYELFNKECLITNANDETNNGLYEVTIFNMPDAGVFDNEEQVINLIETIKSGRK